jgi:hypothetical protein
MPDTNLDQELPEKILLFIFIHNKHNITVNRQTLFKELNLSGYKIASWCNHSDLIKIALENLKKINMVKEEKNGELNIEPSYWNYVSCLNNKTEE